MNIEPLLIFSECYESAVLFISTGKKKKGMFRRYLG